MNVAAAINLPDLLSAWVVPTLGGAVVGFAFGVIVTVASYRTREGSPVPAMSSPPDLPPDPDTTPAAGPGDDMTLMPVVAASGQPDGNGDVPVFAVTDPGKADLTGARGVSRVGVLVIVLSVIGLIVGGVQQAQSNAQARKAAAVAACQAAYNTAVGQALADRATATADSDAATAADRKSNRDLWLAFLAIDQKAPQAEKDRAGLEALNKYLQTNREVDEQTARARATRAAHPLPPPPDCG